MGTNGQRWPKVAKKGPNMVKIWRRIPVTPSHTESFHRCLVLSRLILSKHQMQASTCRALDGNRQKGNCGRGTSSCTNPSNTAARSSPPKSTGRTAPTTSSSWVAAIHVCDWAISGTHNLGGNANGEEWHSAERTGRNTRIIMGF